MINARPLQVEASEPRADDTPENAPKWESPVSEGQESQRIIEVTFDTANTRKWES